MPSFVVVFHHGSDSGPTLFLASAPGAPDAVRKALRGLTLQRIKSITTAHTVPLSEMREHKIILQDAISGID